MTLTIRALLVMTMLFAGAPGWAADNSPWPSANFIARNKSLCPRLDLSALTDGTFSNEAFQTMNWLSPKSRDMVVAEIKKECAEETGGFYCESSVIVRTLDKTRLTDRFIVHLCKKYRGCPEPAAC